MFESLIDDISHLRIVLKIIRSDVGYCRVFIIPCLKFESKEEQTPGHDSENSHHVPVDEIGLLGMEHRLEVDAEEARDRFEQVVDSECCGHIFELEATHGELEGVEAAVLNAPEE